MATPTAPPGGYRLDAEIFAAGTWNGDTFTEDDLRELAANFTRLRGELRPPLKFGHDEGQTLLGQGDGDPALGWVEQVRVAGGKLIATFAGMPRVVYEAIRAGRYRAVSAEIYFNLRRGGRAFGKVLKAVALLGADLPAVTSLQDLTAYLAGSDPWQSDAVRTFTRPLRANSQPMPEPQAMTETVANAAPPQALEAELEELRAYKSRTEAEQAQEQRRRAGEQFRGARQAALAFCEAQVRAGRLAPALRERVLRELDAQAQSYSAAGGLRVSWPLAQALLQRGDAPRSSGGDAPRSSGGDAPRSSGGDAPRSSGGGAAAPFSEAASAPALGTELAHAGDAAEGAEAGDPSARLAAQANRKMVELHLTYSQAAQYVLKTNPGLARAYRDFTLNPSQGA